MADWQQDHAPFHNGGMNLAVPVDKLAEGQHRYLRNVRPFGDGQIHGRQGIETVTAGAAPVADTVHSIKTFEDPVGDPVGTNFLPFNRLAGVGTKLIAAASDTSPDAYAIVIDQHTPGVDAVFSGDPLSFAVASSDYTARPSCIIADSLKMRKYLASIQLWQVGIAPPNFAPQLGTGVVDTGLNGGPDVGTSNNPYLYRFVARSDPTIVTGSPSNPGPPVRTINGLSPGRGGPADPQPGTQIIVTLPSVHPDPQVAWIDIYRFGGSLPVWIYIGSLRNVLPGTFVDNYADIEIASNPLLRFDNYQPFLTVDVPRQGTCSVAENSSTVGSGAVITIQTGDELKAYDATTGTGSYDVIGNSIVVNGRSYTFYRSPDSTSSVEVVEDAGDLDGQSGLSWSMSNPEVARTALQRIFGPWGGGQTGEFIFAVGNPNRPGALYWTVGNRPESHSATGVLDITSASEPLMNGVIYDGTVYVYSSERMFRIYPSFGETSDFEAVEVPNGKGMFSKWGIAVGPKIWTVLRDGIYESIPGSDPVNITDPTLYPLFSHEGVGTTAYPTPDGLTDITLNYPDFNSPDTLRLSYSRDGYLYFDFLDTEGAYRTLVYDTNPGKLQHRGGWCSLDDYSPEIAIHYAEEGESNREVLMGGTDGRIYKYNTARDGGGTIACHIRTSARDQGNARARYHYGDVELDYDSDCQLVEAKAGFDDFSYFSVLATGFVRRIGFRRSVLDIESGKGQYAYNIGLDLQWDQNDGIPKFNFWEASYLLKPVLSRKRVTDWTADGYDGAKFVQGFVLQADTLGVDRSVAVESDGGSVEETFTVNHSGELEQAYSFTTPFITHMLRMHPSDDDFWRHFKVRWIWEPAPELVQYWETQEGSWEFPGFFHHRDCYIPAIASGASTLTITVDGSAFNYTIPDTAGAYLKQYLVLQPMKGKYAKYRIVGPSTGIRVFQRDLNIRAKGWGDTGPYKVIQPFGDLSRVNGARI